MRINNLAVSCGVAFDGKECWCCATRHIQMEELFHAENIWYNTGHQNVYTTYEPFYSRDMQQGFRMGVTTQRLDENEWYSAERAAVQRFQGLQQKNRRLSAQLISAMCQHNSRSLWWRKNFWSTFTPCNKETNSGHYIVTWETGHWCRSRWIFCLDVSYWWKTDVETEGLLFLHWHWRWYLILRWKFCVKCTSGVKSP